MQLEVEREVIRKCKAGDAKFYEPLVRAYEPAGMRVAVGMMGNPDDARDAVQEAFIKVFENLSRFDVARPFRPWFFQILRNQCRDMLRSRQARFRLEALDDKIHLRPGNPELGPERNRQRVAARELLWQGLEAISSEHREILVLKEIEGLRYGEIADIIDIPEGTVASRLYHARRALKDALELQGATYP